jgi:agmatine deiminase
MSVLLLPRSAGFLLLSRSRPNRAPPPLASPSTNTKNQTKNKTQYAEARASLPNEIRVVRMPHDDSWLRDTAPTFVHASVRAPCPQPQPPPVLMATDWRFNGWGDLYGSYERDKAVARQIGKEVGVPIVGVDMVLEGGSIHVDGEG